MPGGPPDQFVHRFSRLSPVARRQFIAELWSARGFDTSVQDTTIIARKADETTRITIPNPERHPGSEYLGTVEITGIDGSEQYTVESVWTELKYGLDESAAELLCHQHLDKSLESMVGTDRHLQTRGAAIIPLAIVITVVLIITVPIVLGTGILFDSPNGAIEAAPEFTTEREVTDPGDASPEERYPPGINQSGLVDPSEHLAGHLNLADRPMGGTTAVSGPAQPKRFDGEPYITPPGKGDWIWTLYRLALNTAHVRVEWYVLENRSIETKTLGPDSAATELSAERSVNTTGTAEPKVRERMDMERDEWFQITAHGDVDATHFRLDNLTVLTYVSPEGQIIYFVVTFEYPDSDERVVIEFFGA